MFCGPSIWCPENKITLQQKNLILSSSGPTPLWCILAQKHKVSINHWESYCISLSHTPPQLSPADTFFHFSQDTSFSKCTTDRKEGETGGGLFHVGSHKSQRLSAICVRRSRKNPAYTADCNFQPLHLFGASEKYAVRVGRDSVLTL